MPLLLLPGASALTATKRAALVKTVQTHHPSVASVDAVFLHYVWMQAELSDAESKILHTLLQYGDDVRLQDTPRRVQAILSSSLPLDGAVIVAPRHGTISPWSSKATDIAKMCNVGGVVKRIERGVLFVFRSSEGSSPDVTASFVAPFAQYLHDRMTQRLLFALPAETDVFADGQPGPLRTVDIVGSEDSALLKLASANKTLGLALADEEMRYLAKAFCNDRNPTDVELFMFAQVNSEHCRHKIFNAEWTIDGQKQDHSLFGMIRNTHKVTPQYTVSAYSDNAAVLEGYSAERFAPFDGSVYSGRKEEAHVLIKVETHNHPTAVSPYPGAATGSGGEIRDEGAVGRGSKPKAGLAGYTVSNLLIPGFEQPWETDFGKPHHIASALYIMIEAPLGSCAFNNEFGRPALTGYFRTFAEKIPTAAGSEVRGYHKPIMIAGGLGNVRPQFALKDKITPGAKIVVLGGPGMLIGLGGGAASSMASGASSADLDFASVQRENPEMQRRCQQVIDACCFSASNPIQSIHDVGAGGLSNALPELVHDAGLGAVFEIRDVLIDDPGMSPMEIWCNESQERYVLAIDPAQLSAFENIAKRERCPYSVVGVATEEQRLVLTDRLLGDKPIDLAMSTLFGKPPKMLRQSQRLPSALKAFDPSLSQYVPQLADDQTAILSEAINRVLRLPSVGSKSFLITIGDRTVTGLVARDQMVGPWQVPVADVAVTQTSYGFDVKTGEAMAMGERTPLALISAAASAKMAVAEALTNLVAASFESLDRVKLSANWMSAASHGDEGALLYDAVQAIGLELCPALGISIPVGKDSMSMSMKWQDRGQTKQVTAPLSLIVTAFAPVDNIRATWTPQLRTDLDTPTVLMFVDLANGKERLGGSALAQVFKQIGNEAPNVESAPVLRSFLLACQLIRREQPDLVLAYHDRSDGGLFTTLVEMAFAGRTGLDISLDAVTSRGDALAALFNEELGAVFQIRQTDISVFTSAFVHGGVPSTALHVVASLALQTGVISVNSGGQRLYSATRADLQQIWAQTSYRMQSLRDNPVLAKEEYENIQRDDKGLSYKLTFEPSATIASTASLNDRPRVAILREQGVNGHVEMAWSFSAAGFTAVDVHMSDILNGRVDLADFKGLAACGGFSYGDVLGAGSGWAKSILLNDTARSQFRGFFSERTDTFALAVCNGCQLFGQLKHLLPDCSSWPTFQPNLSERFEGRVCMLEIDAPQASRSVFFGGMHGSQIPVAVAHGEGRAHFASLAEADGCAQQGLIPLRYIDTQTGKPTSRYPFNPNGGSNGVAGVQSPDGRFLAIMPHPERNTMAACNSYVTSQQVQNWQGRGPWFRIFQNARGWVG